MENPCQRLGEERRCKREKTAMSFQTSLKFPEKEGNPLTLSLYTTARLSPLDRRCPLLLTPHLLPALYPSSSLPLFLHFLNRSER